MTSRWSIVCMLHMIFKNCRVKMTSQCPTACSILIPNKITNEIISIWLQHAGGSYFFFSLIYTCKNTTRVNYITNYRSILQRKSLYH